MPHTRPHRRSSTLRLRAAIFAILALAVAGGAAYTLWPRAPATTDIAPVDVTLRIERLGVDARVQPETTQVVSIPAAAAGDYAFYCDTCCGGKESPSMQGVLKLKA